MDIIPNQFFLNAKTKEMKLTDEQKLEMYKRAIPYLKKDRLGYCSAFTDALKDMGLFSDWENDPYSDIWKTQNMYDLQPFFKESITSRYLLGYGGKYSQHRIKVLEYRIYHLELKLKKKK